MYYHNLHEPSIIEMDTSDFAISTILCQKNKEIKINPVALISKKLSSLQLSFGVVEKQLYTIICILTK